MILSNKIKNYIFVVLKKLKNNLIILPILTMKINNFNKMLF